MRVTFCDVSASYVSSVSVSASYVLYRLTPSRRIIRIETSIQSFIHDPLTTTLRFRIARKYWNNVFSLLHALWCSNRQPHISMLAAVLRLIITSMTTKLKIWICCRHLSVCERYTDYLQIIFRLSRNKKKEIFHIYC